MSLYRLFRLKPAIIGFLLALFVASAHGQVEFIPGSQPRPQGIVFRELTPTGVNTSAWARVGTTTSKFPVPVGSATLGRLTKNALKRVVPGVGWYITLKGLIDGAGWAINELQQQVTDGPAVDQENSPPGTLMWKKIYNNVEYFATNGNSFTSMTEAEFGLEVVFTQQEGDFFCFYFPEGSPNSRDCIGRVTVQAWVPNFGTGHTPSEISDYDLGQLVKTSPQVVNAILIDPETGAPIRTQELINALNALAAANAAANGLDPPDPILSDPSLGEDGTPSQTDWPGFCDWATTVCDFIDWVKAEDTQTEPPEVPFEELPMEPQEWSSGLGGGSCPAPYSTSVSLAGYSANIEFSVEPICELGITMHDLIIAMALILSPMIIGGFRSSKDA